MPIKVTHVIEPELVDLLDEDKRLVHKSNIESAAREVFGNSDLAKQWMMQNNSALGATPLSMLDSDAGVDEVRKILASISYGGVV